MAYGKTHELETDIRVPFYIRGPGIPKNVTISPGEGFGSIIDLLPTFYEFGHGNISDIEESQEIDGESPAGLLTGSNVSSLVDERVDLYVHMTQPPVFSGESCTNDNGRSLGDPINPGFISSTGLMESAPYAPTSIAYSNFSFCFADTAANTTYHCVRTLRQAVEGLSSNTLYCEYPDSEMSLVPPFQRNSLWDMENDPWQMVNLATTASTEVRYGPGYRVRLG